MKIQRIDDLFEVWYPYWEWECYQFGMWGSRKRSEDKIKECKQLLANEVACRAAMQKAITKFSKSAEHHLTKQNGKRPWLGQAACVVALSATEVETRAAWNDLLSDGERHIANTIADQVLGEWRANAKV